MAKENEIGEAYVSIRADTSGFESEAKQSVRKSLDSIDSVVKNALEPIKKTAATQGTKVGKEFGDKLTGEAKQTIERSSIGDSIASLGIGAALAEISRSALDVAGSFEQTEVAFEGLFGNKKLAEDYLKTLQDFAKKTPFEFDQLANIAKKLMATGFETSEIIPMLTKIGDAASNLGVGSEGVSLFVRALGQMKGTGKASMDELNQMSEDLPGFSAVAAIAAGRNQTLAKTFDDLRAGVIPADEAINSILKGLETAKGAQGAMERQSKTLKGATSNLTDSFKILDAQGFKKIIQSIAGALNVTASFISLHPEEVFVGITGAVVALGVALVVTNPEIALAVGKFALMGAAGAAVALAIKKLWQESETFRDIVKEIPQKLSATFNFLRDNWNSVKTTAEILAGVISIVMLPIWITNGVAAVASATKTSIAWAAARVEAVTSAATQSLASVRTIAGWVAAGAAATVNAAKIVAGWVASAAAAVVSGVQTGFVFAVMVAGWVSLGAQSLIQAAKMAASWLIAMGPIGWAIAAIVAIAALVIANWDTIQKGTKKAWEAISNFVTGGIESLKKVFSGFGDAVSKATSGAWEGLRDGFKNALNWIIDKWNNFKIPKIEVNGVQVSPEVNFPDLPRFAKGGTANGWAIVGERGPELAYFSSPTKIVSNEKSKDILSGSSSKTVNVNFYGDTDKSTQMTSWFQLQMALGRI